MSGPAAVARPVEEWSQRIHAAWALVRERLAHPDHTRHVEALRHLLSRRYLVIPFLELDNAFICMPRPTPAGLAEAVANSLQDRPSEFLPPAFRQLHEGGWLTGPGVTPALSDQLFSLPENERQAIRALLEGITQAPLNLPVTRQTPAPGTLETIPTSAELAGRVSAGYAEPLTGDSIPRSAALLEADRSLVVYLRERGRLRPDRYLPIFYKGLKLLPAFGCERLWLYAQDGFEVDYQRDLAATREYAEEGPAFFTRVAFLSPFDVALHLLLPE